MIDLGNLTKKLFEDKIPEEKLNIKYFGELEERYKKNYGEGERFRYREDDIYDKKFRIFGNQDNTIQDYPYGLGDLVYRNPQNKPRIGIIGYEGNIEKDTQKMEELEALYKILEELGVDGDVWIAPEGIELDGKKIVGYSDGENMILDGNKDIADLLRAGVHEAAHTKGISDESEAELYTGRALRELLRRYGNSGDNHIFDAARRAYVQWLYEQAEGLRGPEYDIDGVATENDKRIFNNDYIKYAIENPEDFSNA